MTNTYHIFTAVNIKIISISLWIILCIEFQVTLSKIWAFIAAIFIIIAPFVNEIWEIYHTFKGRNAISPHHDLNAVRQKKKMSEKNGNSIKGTPLNKNRDTMHPLAHSSTAPDIVSDDNSKDCTTLTKVEVNLAQTNKSFDVNGEDIKSKRQAERNGDHTAIDEVVLSPAVDWFKKNPAVYNLDTQ